MSLFKMVRLVWTNQATQGGKVGPTRLEIKKKNDMVKKWGILGISMESGK